MQQPDFIFGHLPFWIVNYGLSAVAWTCIGRAMLSLFVPSLQPTNYIWRAFVLITDWAVRAVAFVTPSVVAPGWLPLLTAFWLFWVRVVLFFVMAGAGLVPTLGGGG